ncbi:MAG: hypothetical protein LBV29_01405, partial [Azoarcus sp.]|nr:hypothetical protein [Azoarcus sp.]
MKTSVSAERKAFDSRHEPEPEEILVLFSDREAGAGMNGGDSLWKASQHFLAYIDLKTGTLKQQEGNLSWLISDKELKQHGCGWPHNFAPGGIYRVLVRKLINKTRRKFVELSCMMVEVLEKDVQNDALLAILQEYRTPMTF